MTNQITRWQDQYNSKLISLAETASKIKPGDVVAFSYPYQPKEIADALLQRRTELRDVTLVSLWMEPQPWFEPGVAGDSFNVVECFGFRGTRQGLKERRIDWLPYVPGLCNGMREAEPVRGKAINFADVAFVSVTPPDENGNCSFGRYVMHMPVMAKTAKTVIGLVNANEVWTCGESIHISDFDYLAELPPDMRGLSEPVSPKPPEDELDAARIIGGYVSELIRDGDTIMVGTGTASKAVLEFLPTKNDLGLDTESIYPELVTAVKAGAISGKKKNVNREKVIASGVVTYLKHPLHQATMDFVNHNPLFEFISWSRLGNVPRIASNNNMVSVTNLLSVDLLGQGVFTHLGTTPIVGPGGQIEYNIGAHYSQGGRSISVLLTTAKGGTISRIVPQFAQGTPVMIPMHFVDYLVTEYGVANLSNKSVRERSQAIIEIAHPKFRDELRVCAKRMFWP